MTERSSRRKRAQRERGPRTRVEHVRLSHSSSISASSSPCAPSHSESALPLNRRTLQRPHPALTAALVLLRTPPRIARRHRPASGRLASLARHLPVRVRASESEEPAVIKRALLIKCARSTTKSDVLFTTTPRSPRTFFFPSFVFLSSYPHSLQRLRCTETVQARCGYGKEPLWDEGAEM
jgi:hypothetical protein